MTVLIAPGPATKMGPYAPLSAGSMTLASVGPAVRVGADDARRQVLEVAAQLLGIPEKSLEVRDGLFHSPALKNPVAIKDVLSELKNFMVIGRGARSPNPEGAHVNTFGAQFVELAVDVETGEVTIEMVIAVHDSGRVVNPLTLSSQVEGGILQGVGFGLLEQRIADRATGVILNTNLEDYKVATIQDVPEIRQEMVDRPDLQANNLGVKGVGEPPIIPTAAAVANAITDALGIRIKDLPITKDRILKLVRIQNP